MLDIVLPAFNGEKYISEQIDSILKQDLGEWTLYIRDDGSSDKTVDIITEYATEYPDKIKLIQDDKGNLGVTSCVFELLKHTKGEYILFCDQDDIWAEKKIRLMKECAEEYARYIQGTPMLVHSDSFVMNCTMEKCIGCLTELVRLKRNHSTFVNLLRKNVVQAASMMINRELLNLAEPLYREDRKNFLYHDLWFALLASVTGKIVYIDEPLTYYRQHENNLVGAGRAEYKMSRDTFWNPPYLFRYDHELVNFKKRVSLFLDNFAGYMTEEQYEIAVFMRDKPNCIGDFIRLGMKRFYSFTDILCWYMYGVIDRE